MLLVTVSVLRVCLLVEATYFSYVVVVVVVVVKYVVHFPCMCHTYFTYIFLTYFGSR